MSVPRHHFGIEFLEKVAASLALATPSPFSSLALLFFASRRLRWRRSLSAGEQARAIGLRETCLLVALTLGAIAAPGLRLIPFPADVTCTVLLLLATGAALLGESASIALIPRPTASDFQGPGLANLAGWLLVSLSAASYWRVLDERSALTFLLCALATSLFPIWMARRNGDPGLLIPGAVLYFLGIVLQIPALAGLGAGVLPAALVWFTYRVKGDFPIRGTLAALTAYGAAFLPAIAAPVAAGLLLLLTLQTWRFWLRFVTMAVLRTLHRFQILGEKNIPYEGPALLVSNHMTMIDGWLLGSFTQRFVRFLVFDGYYKHPASKFGLDLFRSIPVSQGGRRDSIESLRRARHEVIDQGHVAGLFPEGGISRAGYLQPFQKGFTRILYKSDVPIVPAYLNGLWTNFLSFGEESVGMKFPRFFKTLQIEFGAPMPPTTTHLELWRQIKHLEVQAAFRDSQTNPILPVAFLAAARRFSNLPALQSGGNQVSYGELATRAQLLARYLRRRLGEKSRVGVLLPHGPEKITAYLGLALAGHVAFDLGEDPAGSESQSVTTLLSTRTFLDGNVAMNPQAIILIDRFLKRPDFRDSAHLWLLRFLSPHRAWRKNCKFAMRRESAVAVVDSSRGGVVLSHRGVWSAAVGIRRTLWFKPGVSVKSKVLFSRAAGLQLGLWVPLLHGASLHFGEGPAAFEVREGRDALQADERSGHVLVVEDETDSGRDLPVERYLPVLEMPEASGLLSVSAPPVTFAGETQSASKAGTLGKLCFGLEWNEDKVRGPARFLRYLGQEEKTSPARISDWLDAPKSLRLNDQGFVERAEATSQPHTS